MSFLLLPLSFLSLLHVFLLDSTQLNYKATWNFQTNMPFLSSKNYHFENEASLLASFWYRGLEKLQNGLPLNISLNACVKSNLPLVSSIEVEQMVVSWWKDCEKWPGNLCLHTKYLFSEALAEGSDTFLGVVLVLRTLLIKRGTYQYDPIPGCEEYWKILRS